jgi:hypothetical protein
MRAAVTQCGPPVELHMSLMGGAERAGSIAMRALFLEILAMRGFSFAANGSHT